MRNLLPLLIVLLFATPLHGQRLQPYEALADTALQRKVISYLADDACKGRASGTEGAAMAAGYLVRQFREAGLKPEDVIGFLAWASNITAKRTPTRLESLIGIFDPSRSPHEPLVFRGLT